MISQPLLLLVDIRFATPNAAEPWVTPFSLIRQDALCPSHLTLVHEVSANQRSLLGSPYI